MKVQPVTTLDQVNRAVEEVRIETTEIAVNSEDNIECAFTLRLEFQHPTRNLENLTYALGLRPTYFWIKGQRRFPDKPKPIARCNRWSFVQTVRGERLFLAYSARFLESMSSKEDLFSDHILSGGSISLCLGIAGDTNIGDVAPRGFFARLLRLQIDFEIEVFPNWKA